MESKISVWASGLANAAPVALSIMLSVPAQAAPLGSQKYGGLWVASPSGSESGWAVAVDHQGDHVVAVLAMYDGSGSPTWFLMSDPTLYVPGFLDDIFPNTTWQGDIFQFTGPSFDSVPFDSSKVMATQVGAGGFHFPVSTENGTLYWTIKGSGAYGPYTNITRYAFASPVPLCVEGGMPGPVPNYQGFWVSATESGWTLYLAHQGNVIFAVWFTYDANGNPYWVSATLVSTVAGTYSGALEATTGSPFNSAFDPSRVAYKTVGTGAVTFTDGNNGTFAYTLNGVSQTKALTRLIFAGSGTVCQ
jgi:hypothetical protein